MISPLAYVDPSAKLGKNVKVHPFAYIDANTTIGDGCEIMPYASIVHGTVLAHDVKVYQGAIVGADPQDFRWDGCESFCHVGENTVIREHVIINRSIVAGEATSIGAHCLICPNSHIGHDSKVDDYCVIGNNVSIAGNVQIDTCTILSSGVIVHEKCRVGKYALVKGGTRISLNVPPYAIMAHNPVTFYGVNSYIMGKYAGFTEETVDNAAKAFRHIYQSHTSMFNALKRIETDIPTCAVCSDILEFVRASDMKIAGIHSDID